MGQSAGAINVYALLTSPLMVSGQPEAVPSRRAAAAAASRWRSNLPAGSIPTLSPASTYLAQGNALLQQPADRRRPRHRRRNRRRPMSRRQTERADRRLPAQQDADASCCTTLLTQLAPLGPCRAPGRSPTARCCRRPDRRDQRRQLPEGAGARRQHARRRQAVPDLPAAVVGAGGVSGAHRRPTRSCSPSTSATSRTQPPQTTIEQWIPAVVPAGDDAGHRLQRPRRPAQPALLPASRDNVLNALKAQQNNVWYYRFDWDEEPAPWNDIYGAAHAFDLPFLFGNFGPSLFGNVWSTRPTSPAGSSSRTR